MSIALIHANIYLLPVTVLFIIHLDVKKSLPRTPDTRFFLVLVWQTICMMVVEACSWIPEDAGWRGAGMQVWAINIVYMMMNAGFAFSWCVYIVGRIPGKGKLVENKRGLLLLSSPMLLHWLFVLLTPLTRWVFYVDENNAYVRGPFFIIPYLFVGFYMIMVIALAVRQRGRLTRTGEKRECTLLAVYTAIPLGGLLLQLADYKFWSAWPFTALVILTIYISMLNGQITTDGLTGLNNRGQLDKYLMERCDADDGDVWGLMILDVDDFKGINDQYGHIAGDKVLCHVAEILSAVFGDTDAFLSRFGGDEFAVVLNHDLAGGAEGAIQTFHDALEEFNRTFREPYKLALSVGYACYDGKQVNDRHSLMMAADEAMYREKQRKKNGNCRMA